MAKKADKSTRHVVVALMRDAFRKGQSASSFIRKMQTQELSYRRADMLSDWRTINEIERKEGMLRYVRKDYYPAEPSIAAIEWDLSQEYMYKVKTKSRLRPDEPVIDRYVSIMSDVPLTPREVEQQIWSRWGEWEKYEGERLEELTVWSAYRRKE